MPCCLQICVSELGIDGNSLCSLIGSSIKVAVRPASTCHSMWQWNSEILLVTTVLALRMLQSSSRKSLTLGCRPCTAKPCSRRASPSSCHVAPVLVESHFPCHPMAAGFHRCERGLGTGDYGDAKDGRLCLGC